MKAGLQMKREMMMKVVFTSWLVLILSIGSSQTSFGAPDHGTDGTSGTSRPAVAEVPLPQEYEMLLEALGKIDSRGLDIEKAVDVEGNEKNLDGSVADKAKLIKWITTVRDYRKDTASCAINGDRSADQLGNFIDDMVINLQKAITLNPLDAEGLKEKHLITFVSQIERYMEEKKKLFPAEAEEFEKADKALVTQLKNTLSTVFGAVNFDKFTLEQQKTDAWSKPFTEKMDSAIEALNNRAENDRKACVAAKENKEDEDDADKKKEEEEKKKKEEEEKKKEEEDKKKKEDEEKKKLTDKPTPILGNPQDGGEQPGDEPGGDDPGVDDPTTGVDGGIDDPIVDDGDVFDPFGNGVVDPGNEVVQDLDDAFLRDILDRLAEQEKDQEDNFEKLLDDAQDRLNDGLRAAQDAAAQIARDQAAAIDAQKNNDAANLADLAKGLNGKNGATPPPPPAPLPPITPPQISAGGGSDSGLPFPPPPEEPLPPPPQAPFYMPPPPSSAPVVIGETRSRFEDEFVPYPPRPIPAPRNAQGGAMLELVRMQQQLMYAQQQAQQNPANVRLNVNTMAGRLGGVGAARGVPSRGVPSQGSLHNRLGQTSRSNQSTGVSANPSARSSTVPASLQRGSLSR